MIDGTQYFDCECGVVEHALRLTLDLDEKLIYVDSYCDQCRTFIERIKYAWHHIKGDNGYDGGAFHDKILQFEDTERLANMLMQITDIKDFGGTECKIASTDNLLHFVLDTEDEDMPPMLRVETELSRRDNWASCIWYAVAYVFGRKSRYGGWDCFEIDSEAAATLLYQLNAWDIENEKFEKVVRVHVGPPGKASVQN